MWPCGCVCVCIRTCPLKRPFCLRSVSLGSPSDDVWGVTAGRVGQTGTSEGQPCSKGFVWRWWSWPPQAHRSSGRWDWRPERPGWVWEGTAFSDYVTPSPEIDPRGNKQDKTATNGNQSPWAVTRDGGIQV